MANARVVQALCSTDASEEHTMVLVDWVEEAVRGANVANVAPAGADRRSELCVLRSCARALATRLAETGEIGALTGRVVDALCGLVCSLVLPGSSPGARPQDDVNVSVDDVIVEVISSVFGYLRGLRVQFVHATNERGVDASTNPVVDMTQRSIGSAVRGYVKSRYLSPQGYVRAVQLYPAVALQSLLEVCAHEDGLAHSENRTNGKACLLACVDDRERFGGVIRHAPDVLAAGESEMMSSSNSPLESALEVYAYEDVSDCHRMLQQLSVCFELGGLDKGLVGGAIERLTRRVLGRKNKEDVAVIMQEAVENFEEGELLVSVCKSDADVRRKSKGVDQVAGMVPRRIGCGMVVRGLVLGSDGRGSPALPHGEVIGEELVRRCCDTFAAVKRVMRLKREADVKGIDMGSFLVEMTSMPGAVRCYEAMCTRERRFWGDIGARLVDVPGVEMMGPDQGAGYQGLFLEGVESIEQEDLVKEMLDEKSLPRPSSWVPVGAGVKGVVLCFQSEEDGKIVFKGLGGVINDDEEKFGRFEERSQWAANDPHNGTKRAHNNDDVDNSSKRARTSPVPPKPSKTIYKLLRNRQYQGSFIAEPLDGAGPLDGGWPDTLDASQRVDINYLYNSLFPSSSNLRIGALWPSEESDGDGLRRFDGYLRQKGRAGVVVMGRRTLYLIPSTPEACTCLGIGKFYGDNPCSAMICVLVDE